MMHKRNVTLILAGLLAILPGEKGAAATPTAPIAVCASTSDLGSLFERIGGDQVAVTVFASGAQDPHFLEARPGIVRALSRCQIYAEVGLELEIGWAPAALDQARNAALRPGGRGYFAAANYIEAREIPGAAIDRSAGHVHAAGSPHFLVDPAAGVLVARGIRDFLNARYSERREQWSRGYNSLEAEIMAWLVGESLSNQYRGRLHRLALLLHRDGHSAFVNFLRQQNQGALLGGVMKRFQPYQGHSVVGDHHGLWSYLFAVYGLRQTGTIEEKPGVSPSTAHLRRLIDSMQRAENPMLVIAPYFPEAPVSLLSAETGAPALRLAHQTGATACARDYPALLRCNADLLLTALEQRAPR